MKRIAIILDLLSSRYRSPFVATANDFRTGTRLGEAYAKSGRPVAALKALGHAASISPDECTCAFLMGVVHQQMEQYELAIAKYEQILLHHPDEPGVPLSLADAFLELGRSQFSTGLITRSDSSFASSIAICLCAIDAFTSFRCVAWKTVADALFELSKPRCSQKRRSFVTLFYVCAKLLYSMGMGALWNPQLQVLARMSVLHHVLRRM